MGNGIERAYSKLFFITNGYNIRKLIFNSSWFLYRTNPRAYKVQKLKISENGETPGGFRMAQKSLFGQHLLLFSVIPAKTQQAY